LFGAIGQTLTVVVQTVNPNDNTVTGPASSSANIKLIDPNGDDDGDGMTNAAEDTAGTNPFDPKSVFRVTAVTPTSVSWSSVPGKKYHLDMATSAGGTYSPVGVDIVAAGSTSMETVSSSAPAFYRVRVVTP
jgi:hypothetical protein